MSIHMGVIYDTAGIVEMHRPAGPDQLTAIAVAADAITQLTPDLLVPYDAGLTVACLDEGGEGTLDRSRRPACWHRWLVRSDLPDDVDAHPFYVDADIVEIPQIDRSAIVAMADDLLAQDCPVAGTALSWTELYVTHAWVRLPLVGRNPTSVVVDDLDGHRLDHVVPTTTLDGSVGIAGRSSGVDTVPIEVRVDHDEGSSLRLQLLIRWSTWYAADARGRALLDPILLQLEARGWAMSNPPPQAERSEPQEYVGTYQLALERSTFRPDGHAESWWVAPHVLRGHPDLVDDGRGTSWARVRLRGRLSPPGAHGHFGAWERELQVDAVVAVEPTEPPRFVDPMAPEPTDG